MASSPNIASDTSAKNSSAWRWRTSCRPASLNMAKDDDPRAPYKVYEGEELKGTYATRAEARRAQQRFESQAAGSVPRRNFIIRDNLERVVVCDRPRASTHEATFADGERRQKTPVPVLI